MRLHPQLFSLALVTCLAVAGASSGDKLFVGVVGPGTFLTPTGQFIKPAGNVIEFFGRPSDLALDPVRHVLAVKNSHGIVLVDTTSWRIIQNLPMPKLAVDFAEHLGGNGPAGILWAQDGSKIWTTDSFGWIHGATRENGGHFAWTDAIALPSPTGSKIFENDKNGTGSDSSAPIGMTWGRDGKTMFVALSRDNALGAVDASNGRILYDIRVGNAPFGVCRVGGALYVSNWAGRASAGSRDVADSSGTNVRVDRITGATSSGTVSVIDIARRRVSAELEVGLHPSAILASRDGARVYIANSNSDTISVVNTKSVRVVRTIALDDAEPFGRTPTALALSSDQKMLYVAEGGSNDIAVVDLATGKVNGRIAAGWYPAAVLVHGSVLYVADLKGVGSLAKTFGLALPKATIEQRGGTRGHNAYDYAGLIQRVSTAGGIGLADEWIRATDQNVGALKKFKHVLFIIGENHTYDDYFGDMAAGNGERSLCVFCASISPNHHALAVRFGLFDNFYVNSVLSADGHNWTSEGYASDYVERSLSGWGRSYPSAGNDPMAYSPKGFIWNKILAHGLTFRDYGEFFPDMTDFSPANPTWSELYNDYQHGTHHYRWTDRVNIAPLRPYVDMNYPSFSLRIPDQVRADAFIADLREFERIGRMPNFMLMALGNDHTSGTYPGRPTPRAYAADNDLALGRIVSAVSHSKFWRDTVIFVVEDDAQDGLDHVDGHRTMALVVSAYQTPGAVYHEFYDQTSILRTVELIFGLTPMTRFDANATAITAAFNSQERTEPYDAKPSEIRLDELTPNISALSGIDRAYAQESMRMDFDNKDREDGARMAHIIRAHPPRHGR